MIPFRKKRDYLLYYFKFIIHLHSQNSQEDLVAQLVEHSALRKGARFFKI
jgi:hypothetical protein